MSVRLVADFLQDTCVPDGGLASSAWHNQSDGPPYRAWGTGQCGGGVVEAVSRLEERALGRRFPKNNCLTDGGWLARHGTIA